MRDCTNCASICKKDVPTHTAFAFMLTAPIINPIVLFSTYVAFSGATKFVIWRVLGSMIVAWVIGIWLAYFRKESILTEKSWRRLKKSRLLIRMNTLMKFVHFGKTAGQR